MSSPGSSGLRSLHNTISILVRSAEPSSTGFGLVQCEVRIREEHQSQRCSMFTRENGHAHEVSSPLLALHIWVSVGILPILRPWGRPWTGADLLLTLATPP